MSPLQQRMLEDMQLRGLSARTREAYARAVWQLAKYYHRSAEQLSDEDLRQYFLYLTNEKKIARPAATIALCGIKFFYEQTMEQPWPTLRFARPAREWLEPVQPSYSEVTNSPLISRKTALKFQITRSDPAALVQPWILVAAPRDKNP